MHKSAVAPLVFSRLFPDPKSSDPTSLQAHITRNLVPEVRSETACFYGPIDCLEAQYPGLDYANSAHRVRLGRYPWHRKLFRVFDQLRLSDHEIQTFCRWEGTRWARERYEKDEGVKIKDTTWDGIRPALHMAPTIVRVKPYESGNEDERPSSILEDQIPFENEFEQEAMEDSDDLEEESEDELQHSVGVELNRRLLLAIEARARGEEVVLDEDWEQWLKEAVERGAVLEVLDIQSTHTVEAITELSRSYGQQIPEISRSHSSARTPTYIATVRERLAPPPPLPTFP